MPFNPSNVHQDVAHLATEEGLKILAEELALKQTQLEERDKDVVAAEAEMSRLQTRHAVVNAATIEAGRASSQAERELVDQLIEAQDVRLNEVAPKHEAQGAMYRAGVATVKHIATVRLPQASLNHQRALVERQLAAAEVAEATARLCIGHKLTLLEKLWEFEGPSLTTTGGISEEAIQAAAFAYETYARMAASFREAEASFDAKLQQTQ